MLARNRGPATEKSELPKIRIELEVGAANQRLGFRPKGKKEPRKGSV